MWLKWIRCRLDPVNKQEFSRGQQQWNRCAGLDGFRGQIGGWRQDSSGNSAEACILALWRDELSYRHFMTREHDRVLEGNPQQHIIQHIRVQFAEIRLEVAGSHTNLLEALAFAKMLRCLENPLQQEALPQRLAEQQRIWAPDLPCSPGLLCAMSAWHLEEQQLLNFSLWQDQQSLDFFANSIYPDLQRRWAGESPTELCSIELNPDWTVLAVENS